MSVRLALFVLFVSAGVLPASGQPARESGGDFDGLARAGIDQVYNLDFERAERTFGNLIAMRPSHPAGHFFLAMVDWWRIMIDIDNEQYDERFFAQLDHVVEMCDSMLGVNPDDLTAIFFKGGSIGFQGRLKFHRNDYLGAANAGRKALPLVQQAHALDPSNYDILLGTGIYNYYAEVIPNEYPIAKPLLLFIPPGDRKKGIEQLALASEKGKYAAVESAYFLMQIEYFYERDYVKALSLASTLHRRFPNNMLFHRYVGRSHSAMGNWAEARDCFAEIVRRVRAGSRGYTAVVEREAEYYLGSSAMALGTSDAALAHFYRCDELSRTLDRNEPSGFMAMANLKIGNIYDLQGKRDLAVEQYNKVLGLKDYRGSHDLAETFLKNPYGR
jgi:tetratricopeptide (TPR) repeat protein